MQLARLARAKSRDSAMSGGGRKPSWETKFFRFTDEKVVNGKKSYKADCRTCSVLLTSSQTGRVSHLKACGKSDAFKAAHSGKSFYELCRKEAPGLCEKWFASKAPQTPPARAHSAGPPARPRTSPSLIHVWHSFYNRFIFRGIRHL